MFSFAASTSAYEIAHALRYRTRVRDRSGKNSATTKSPTSGLRTFTSYRHCFDIHVMQRPGQDEQKGHGKVKNEGEASVKDSSASVVLDYFRRPGQDEQKGNGKIKSEGEAGAQDSSASLALDYVRWITFVANLIVRVHP